MVDLLAEMLREAERGVDQQMKVLEGLDDKSEQLLTLGLATLGAGLALAAFVIDRFPGRFTLPIKLLLAGAVAANLGALLGFLHPYAGLFRRMDAFSGPSPRWLREKVNEADWTAEMHVVSVVSAYARYFEHNARIISHHRLSHRIGLLLLLGSALVSAGTSLYVVW